MKKRLHIFISLSLIFTFLTACESTPAPTQENTPPQEIGVANPASVYCTETGYRVATRTDEEGGQYGVCIFNDGTECDEWAYFNGECGPVIRPEPLPDSFVPVRDAVISFINQNYPEANPPEADSWESGVSSNPTFSKLKTYRLTSGNWIMTISHPIAPPGSSTPITFSILVNNLHPEETFFWRGEVDESGILKETFKQ